MGVIFNTTNLIAAGVGFGFFLLNYIGRKTLDHLFWPRYLDWYAARNKDRSLARAYTLRSEYQVVLAWMTCRVFLVIVFGLVSLAFLVVAMTVTPSNTAWVYFGGAFLFAVSVTFLVYDGIRSTQQVLDFRRFPKVVQDRAAQRVRRLLTAGGLPPDEIDRFVADIEREQ